MCSTDTALILRPATNANSGGPQRYDSVRGLAWRRRRRKVSAWREAIYEISRRAGMISFVYYGYLVENAFSSASRYADSPFTSYRSLSGLGTSQDSRNADTQLKAARFPAVPDIGVKNKSGTGKGPPGGLIFGFRP